MNIKNEVNKLQSEIKEIVKKEECMCGKTLFFYDDQFIYIKCRRCGLTRKFKR